MPRADQVVGLGRLELPTSRLSSARSNQLSYKPLTPLFCKGSERHREIRHLPDVSRERSPERMEVKARVRPRRKRNEDGEIPPMELNDLAIGWPRDVSKRSDKEA